MNDDGDLYSKHSDLQKRDAAYFLDNYLKLHKWKSDAHILDVGAGEGTVTYEVLLPRLPKSFKQLVLGDIQQNLVEYAASKNKDLRTECLQMDISDKSAAKKFQEHFDFIFSHNCLNWISDETKQQQALQNIFDMLKPGGDVLLLIISSFPTYDYCENMAQTEQWAPYMPNVKQFTSLYHHLKDPAQKLNFFLKNAGFDVRVCEADDRCYTYSSFSHYLNLALSVNAFINKVPQNKRDSFIEDFQKEIRNHNMTTIEPCEDGNEKVHLRYRSLIVRASKPL